MKRFTAFMLMLISAITLCSCNTLKLYKLSDTYFIMDTPCTITAGGTDKAILHTSLTAAFDRVCEVEAYTDRFSPDSDVSAINNAEQGTPIPVSNDTINILQTALEVCEKSKGAFDITIAPVVDLWDFKSGNHQPPSEEDIKAALTDINYKSIIIDSDNKTVTKISSNTKIDLGGCAKGYAADCALEVLKSFGVSYALLDFGGNILTYGNNPSKADGKWTIGIQKPFSKNGEYSKTLSVTDKAVVTSGTYQRYFEYDGSRYHHIIDPKTGYPADNKIDSVTIAADNALLADCLSTACLVLGEEGAKLLASEYNCEIYIISEKINFI